MSCENCDQLRAALAASEGERERHAGNVGKLTAHTMALENERDLLSADRDHLAAEVERLRDALAHLGSMHGFRATCSELTCGGCRRCYVAKVLATPATSPGDETCGTCGRPLRGDAALRGGYPIDCDECGGDGTGKRPAKGGEKA